MINNSEKSIEDNNMIKKIGFKLIILIFLMIFFTTIFISFDVFAGDDRPYLDANQFEGNYAQAAGFKVSDRRTLGQVMYGLLGGILAVVRYISLGYAILMAVIIAIKFIISGPGVKAQLKTDLPTYLMGSVILFGATGLFSLIKLFIDENI